MNFNALIAKLHQPKVDSILSSINRNIARLEAAAAANNAKAEALYAQVERLEEKRSCCRGEQSRALTVASKLRALVS